MFGPAVVTGFEGQQTVGVSTVNGALCFCIQAIRHQRDYSRKRRASSPNRAVRAFGRPCMTRAFGPKRLHFPQKPHHESIHALLISAAHSTGQAAAEKASAYGLALAIQPKVFTSLHQSSPVFTSLHQSSPVFTSLWAAV